MTNELLTFLTLLANASRLDILGLLIQQPRSVDELAAILSLSPSTISHHLTRLHNFGLVSASAEQYYHIYRINLDRFQTEVARLTPENLDLRVRTSERVNDELYEQQALAQWIEENRLRRLPRQVKQRAIVLQWLVEKFEPDKRYDWDQVGELLDQWCDWRDSAAFDETALHRALVETKRLSRLPDGSWHWRTDSALAQGAGFTPESLPIAETPDINRYTPVRAAAKAKDPSGVYANLQPKSQLPNPRRDMFKLILRLKADQYYTQAEIEALIRQHHNQDPVMMRTALLREGLLKQNDDGMYWREPIK